MSAKPRTIKFTDADWQALQALASSTGLTVSKLIHRAISEYAAKHGVSLEGTGSHGGQRYYQCSNCGGWNVGTFEGQLICADCGEIKEQA